jgi:hypothetical protein
MKSKVETREMTIENAIKRTVKKVSNIFPFHLPSSSAIKLIEKATTLNHQHQQHFFFVLLEKGKIHFPF